MQMSLFKRGRAVELDRGAQDCRQGPSEAVDEWVWRSFFRKKISKRFWSREPQVKVLPAGGKINQGCAGGPARIEMGRDDGG